MLFLLTFQWIGSNGQNLSTNEAEARAFLDYFNTETQTRGAKMAELNWMYKTNITDYNQEQMVSTEG